MAAEQLQKTWLDNVHPYYKANRDRWVYVGDHYSGTVTDPIAVKSYLVRKGQSETVESYDERTKLSDYTPHFATLVDSLAGMLFSAEPSANRTFVDENGIGLGDPADAGTVMHRLYSDTDGRGNGWLTVWKQFVVKIVHSHFVWIAVDSVDGRSFVRVLSPLRVPNWREGPNGLEEVLVKEWFDSRESIKDESKEQYRYVHYSTSGWQRWRKDDKGAAIMVDEGAYNYVGPHGAPALPIFNVRLPMDRAVGYLMARKANAIFNKESERDHLLRTANFPFLNIIGDDDQYDAILKGLKKGSRVLQNDPEHSQVHGFIAPSAESAKAATEVLTRKVEEFYITGFREYGDSARERTATEVRHDVSSGVGAFLQMLKASADDGENGALWRIEQTEFAGDSRRWFVANVERSSDFVPIDYQLTVDKLAKRYFGEKAVVPLGPVGFRHIVKQIAEYDGIELDDEEMIAAVELHMIERSTALMAQLPITPEAQAEMTVRYLGGLGLINPEETIEVEGGEKRLKKDIVYEEALRMAQAEQASHRDFLQQAQF